MMRYNSNNVSDVSEINNSDVFLDKLDKKTCLLASEVNLLLGQLMDEYGVTQSRKKLEHPNPDIENLARDVNALKTDLFVLSMKLENREVSNALTVKQAIELKKYHHEFIAFFDRFSELEAKVNDLYKRRAQSTVQPSESEEESAESWDDWSVDIDEEPATKPAAGLSAASAPASIKSTEPTFNCFRNDWFKIRSYNPIKNNKVAHEVDLVRVAEHGDRIRLFSSQEVKQIVKDNIVEKLKKGY